MKQLLLTITSILFALNLFGQDNCFERCVENFETSTLPFPEKGEHILQGLIGCKAPNFSVKTIAGETLDLIKLKGKVVVINFWFENCAPCLAEIPALNRLREDYKTQDVVFIAFGRDDTPSIRAFLKKRHFDYHLVSSDYDLTKYYCLIGGWPMNMVLDRNGILRQVFCGGSTDETAQTQAYDKMYTTIAKYLSN